MMVKTNSTFLLAEVPVQPAIFIIRKDRFIIIIAGQSVVSEISAEMDRTPVDMGLRRDAKGGTGEVFVE